MTKKEMFNALLAMDSVKANAEIVEKIKNEIALLEKKSGAEKKPTKTQKENETFKKAILDYLKMVEKKAVRELMVEVKELEGLSTPKVSALITLLVKEGLIHKETVKKINYYSIVKEDNVGEE